MESLASQLASASIAVEAPAEVPAPSVADVELLVGELALLDAATLHAKVAQLRAILTEGPERTTPGIITTTLISGAAPSILMGIVKAARPSPSTPADDMLRFECIWVLCLLVEYCWKLNRGFTKDSVVATTILPFLGEAFRFHAAVPEVARQQICFCFGQLAECSDTLRDQLVEAGVMSDIIRILTELPTGEIPPLGVTRMVARTIGAFASVAPSLWDAVSCCTPIMEQLLYVEDVETVEPVLRVLTYWTSFRNKRITLSTQSILRICGICSASMAASESAPVEDSTSTSHILTPAQRMAHDSLKILSNLAVAVADSVAESAPKTKKKAATRSKNNNNQNNEADDDDFEDVTTSDASSPFQSVSNELLSVLEPLCAHANEDIREECRIITSLIKGDFSQTILTSTRIPWNVRQLRSGIKDVQLDACMSLRMLLSTERNPPISEVVSAGAVPLLISLMSDPSDARIQFEAAWALTNVASGSSAHTQVVVTNGGINGFIKLLSHTNRDIVEQAVWGLGNIAGDSSSSRDNMLSQGVVNPMVSILKDCITSFTSGGSSRTTSIALLRNCVWATSNLCRGKPAPPMAQTIALIPALRDVLANVDDVEARTDALWAISYFADGPNERIQACIDIGLLPLLISSLHSGNYSIQTPALRALGNVVTGDDLQTAAALQAGLLHGIAPMLSSPKKAIRKETAWTLSNITAGTPEQIQMVIDCGALTSCIALLTTAEFEIKKEACWAVSNATSGGTYEQINWLVGNGALEGLCSILECHDPKIIQVALEGIENILSRAQRNPANNEHTGGNNSVLQRYTEIIEACGGLDRIETLQSHESMEVYNKSVAILETYFAAEDDDTDLTNNETSNAFAF